MTVVPATRFLGTGQIIDGQRVPAAAGGTLPVEDPATGELFASIPAASAEDVDRAVESARAASGRPLEPAAGHRARTHPHRAGRPHPRPRRGARRPGDTRHRPSPPDARFDVADTAHHFEYYAGLAGKTTGEAHLLSTASC